MPRAKVIRIAEHGGPEVLVPGEIEVREPGPGELLVEVLAVGVNRGDTLQRRGLYPAPPGVPSDVPGLEYAGTVIACGEDVTGVSLGDRVMGIVAGGGMSTLLVTHYREALPVPEGMSLTDAAAIPEVFLTAYDALFDQAQVGIGQTVLLHSVGSGVGTAALQLVQMTGARPIGTSRSADKIERCRALGLEEGIVITDRAFADEVRRRTGGQGAEVILDTVGAAYLEENLAALSQQGILVVIGLMGGVRGELRLDLLLRSRAQVRGTVLRSRPLEEKAALCRRFARHVLPLFGEGGLRPIIDDVLPMSDAAEAHRRIEGNRTFGKLVLTW